MRSLIIILVWAVVGGAWSWSSSEVSCASCGSECQAACGTRNFRACCFNFQRRRRAQVSSLGPLNRPAGVLGGREWLNGRGNMVGGQSALVHLIRALTPALDLTPIYPYVAPRPVLSSPFLQDFGEEDKEEEEEEEQEEEFTDASISRLFALALHSPHSALSDTSSALRSPSSVLHNAPSALQGSQSALNAPSSALRQRYQPQASGKLRK